LNRPEGRGIKPQEIKALGLLLNFGVAKPIHINKFPFLLALKNHHKNGIMEKRVRDPRQSRGLEFVNRSKRLSRLKAAESIAYLKVFSAIPAACPQLPIFTYISPDCLRTLILPLTFVGCIYSSFSLSFGIHTEVFYIVVNVKHWESPGKAGGLPFKLIAQLRRLWFALP